VAYQYQGIDTCAATGLCAQRCPVGINTGDLVRVSCVVDANLQRSADWLAVYRAVRRASCCVVTNGVRLLMGAPYRSHLRAAIQLSNEACPAMDLKAVPQPCSACGYQRPLRMRPRVGCRVMGPAAGDSEQMP
jgi:D-lactate dehydrogenase